MEEMKERFYNAVNELNALQNNEAEFYSYDAEHEKRRKEQLIKQWNRTKEEVFLSAFLLVKIRVILRMCWLLDLSLIYTHNSKLGMISFEGDLVALAL